MYKKLLLALVLTAFLTCGATAQSSKRGSDGSGAKSSGSSSKNSGSARKQQQQDAKQRLKLVGMIQREDFEGIKFSKTQKQTLKELVASNYDGLSKIDMQMASLVPANKSKMLKKSFLMAQREGKSEMESMTESMKSIGLPSNAQNKMMELSKSKESIMEKIRMGVMETFTAEQKAMAMDADGKDDNKDIAESSSS